jgi:hypothetical protein
MILQALTKLVDEEVEKRVNEKLTKYAEYVSKTYDISIKLLMRDMLNINELVIPNTEICKPGQCLGINMGGKRCKFKGKQAGYCSRHVEQKPKAVIQIKSAPPSAIKNSVSTDNLLIDI